VWRGFRLTPTTALPNSPSRCVATEGHGLGHLLMARLIQLARQRGIDGLVGEVLPENVAMLQLCREFGFTITIDPRDPTLRLASKTLQDQGYCRRSDEVDFRTVASVRYLNIPLVAAEGWLDSARAIHPRPGGRCP
jgi:hypothetical protein